MRPADISPMRVFPSIPQEDKTVIMGPMVSVPSPGFALRPPRLQRIPKTLQIMLEEERKSSRKRRSR